METLNHLNLGEETMKRLLSIAVALVLTAMVPSSFAGGMPRTLAGFTLGTDIEQYKDRLRMRTDLPIRHMECIHELEIRETPGYKSGLVAYGTCAEPGKILRIKFKYANPTRRFYEKLLDRFTSKFGKPMEWRGDPFHIVIAWKWSFVDENGGRLSMILQHNLRDHDEKMGNSVKMTLTTQIREEIACFEKKHGDKEAVRDRRRKEMGEADWDMLIPH
jgi:hypothetical protein